MLDAPARRALDRPLARTAQRLDRLGWLTANRMTLAGLALGLASAAAAASTWWPAALTCWLLSRLADGRDGPLARHRRKRVAPGARAEPSDERRPVSHAGGFLDISADFVVYGTTVVGVAIGVGGSPWPFVAVLLGYYLNGAILLVFSSIAERTGRTVDDGVPCRLSPASPRAPRPWSCTRSGWSLPGVAGQVAAGWAVVVGISVVQRICLGYRRLL